MNKGSRRTCVKRRRGLASLELVMITAVALPLAIVLLILAAKISSYVFKATAGLLSVPWL